MVADANARPTDARLERAQKRAKELREFYVHLSVYLIVNIALTAGLFTINWLTAPGDWWFYWPLIGTGIGWGIGLLIHAANVFGGGKAFGEEWEERKVQELLDRDRVDPLRS